jgi:beta-lactamase class D
LVDPHFSRLDIKGKEPLIPDQAAIARYAPARADVILVGHSHHDHLLDVPDVAKRTGATILGTESTLNVARAAGLPESRTVDLTGGGKTWSEGPWTVQAVRSLHSLTGAPSLPIPRNVTLPMNADAYLEGGVLDYLVTVGGRKVFFISTANLIDRELEGLRPDVAVVASGLREKIPDYTCRTLRALGSPKLVIANHFDAWWRPLGPNQMDIEEADRASLAKFPAEVEQCAPGTKVVIPTHLQPIDLQAALSPAPSASPSCFLLHEVGVGEVRRAPAELCGTRLSPFSTFKIPHAVAALDSGVLTGPDVSFPYDGAAVDFPSHQRDHNLQSAIRDSVVWYFQRIATTLGPGRERAYLDKLEYGNRDSSSGLTTFWLGGSLQISPEEQARFMVQLYEDRLPVSKKAMQTVRELLVQPAGMVVHAAGRQPFAGPWPEGTVVSAKTGRGADVAWLVGHVRRGSRAWVFVSAVVAPSKTRPLAAIELAAESLREAEVL